MKAPRNREGRLTEQIMERVREKLPDLNTATYNRIYEGVYAELKSVEKLNLAIVPDNDWAFMAKFTAMKPADKKMIMELAESLAA